MFAYKTTSGSAPLYLNSVLQTYVPSRSLRSSSERLSEGCLHSFMINIFINIIIWYLSVHYDISI